MSLQEYKVKTVVELELSQAKIFTTTGKVIRTSTSCPSLLQPVLFSPHQIELQGKAPGRMTLWLYDDEGHIEGIDVRIYNHHEHLLTSLRRIGSSCFHLVAGDQGESTVKPARLTPVRLDQMNGRPSGKRQADKLARAVPDYRPPTPLGGYQHHEGTEEPPGEPEAETTQPGQSAQMGTIGEAKLGDLNLDLRVKQSRLFKADRNLTATSSDSDVCDPYLPDDRHPELIGWKAGYARIRLAYNKQDVQPLLVRVRNERSSIKDSLLSIGRGLAHNLLRVRSARQVPLIDGGSVLAREYRVTGRILLSQSEDREYAVPGGLQRLLISDPTIADLLPTEDGFILCGRKPGVTTLFVWTIDGNRSGFVVRVARSFLQEQQQETPSIKDTEGQCTPPGICTAPFLGDSPLPPPPPLQSPVKQFECWTGARKSIWQFLPRSASEPEHSSTHNESRSDEVIEPTPTESITKLNNEAVIDLMDDKPKIAMSKLKEALRQNPEHAMARTNLSEVYTTCADDLYKKPQEAIRQLHNALYVNPYNKPASANLQSIIWSLQKDPKNAADRESLGDTAAACGDWPGAIIEYEEALRIKSTMKTRWKLRNAFASLTAIYDQLWMQYPDKHGYSQTFD